MSITKDLWAQGTQMSGHRVGGAGTSMPSNIVQNLPSQV